MSCQIDQTPQIPELDQSSLPPRRREQVKIKDLCILDLPAPGEHNKVKPWEGQEDLFAAESCARKLYVLSKEQLKNVPDEAKEHSRQKDCYGADAYRFFLEFACGLQSDKLGEYHVKSQLKNRWESFDKKHKDAQGPTISKLIQFIFEDSKAIRDKILQNLVLEAQNRQLGKMIAARALAGLKGGEDILIIAGSEFETLELVNVLGRACERKSGGRIVVTHPNAEFLEQIFQAVLRLKRDKKLDCPMESVAFDGIARAMNSSDHVFVLKPMATASCDSTSTDYQQDKRIQQAWLDRERQDGFLIHLKGDPRSRGATTPDWAEMRKPRSRFYSPEDVNNQHHRHIELNNSLIASARTAAQNCAFSRSIGQRPRFDAFQLPHHRYREKCLGEKGKIKD